MTLSVAFFKIVNFCTFFIVGYLIYKKYFLQNLYQAMLTEKKEKKEQENNYYVLKNEQEKIKQDIVAQLEEAKHLQDKINIWSEKICTEKALLNQIETRLQQQNDAQRKKQHENFIRNKMHQRLIHRALLQAENHLIAKFKNENAGTIFLDALCEKIEKGHL